ncbi:MAG TPA: Tex family protein [Desulfitobacteriaceae bacterium]|nr:Tex family protein [Desulfitobacteriaceae bacterium]
MAGEFKLKTGRVKDIISLFDADNTIPFIARYRKEATGGLDENILRSFKERLEYLHHLEQRKTEVGRLIAEQGKLTAELQSRIEAATVLQEVEDLYRPYKQKRRTRAGAAKEKGLEPLAQWIFTQSFAADPVPADLAEEAQKYISSELGVGTIEEALTGASDIIAEIIADDAALRKELRILITRRADIVAVGRKTAERSAFEMYYNYREPLRQIPPHRILALNRGEKEEVLTVKTEVPLLEMLPIIAQHYPAAGSGAPVIHGAAKDAYKRLLAPSLEREVRAELTGKAEEQALKVFSANLRQLLLQPPLRGKVILGLDPGFRTGCKWAVVDDSGNLLQVGVIYPHPPQNKRLEALESLEKVIREYGVNIIAIGNGTASRESEMLAAELIKTKGLAAEFVIVSEAGASVYSASKLAGEEFPDFDLSLRSAVSIARRLQDPLAELVKIEPKALGVGQYQHDVQPQRLAESLHGTVESCVNAVGVDLNTASPSLLQYVAGLKPAVVKNIIAWRKKNGKFRRREQLKEISRLGEQTYVQCAGFIRLPEGENPLENTPVHPESYQLAAKILGKAGYKPADLGIFSQEIARALALLQPKELAAEFAAGLPTIQDIIDSLQRPGRDPREDLPSPLLRQDILHLEDISPGMLLEGTVRNVVDFGAFIDVGVKHDGLVHISQLSSRYIRHPMEVVAVGDIVKVRVINIDRERERLSLSLLDAGDN